MAYLLRPRTVGVRCIRSEKVIRRIPRELPTTSEATSFKRSASPASGRGFRVRPLAAFLLHDLRNDGSR